MVGSVDELGPVSDVELVGKSVYYTVAAAAAAGQNTKHHHVPGLLKKKQKKNKLLSPHLFVWGPLGHNHFFSTQLHINDKDHLTGV